MGGMSLKSYMKMSNFYQVFVQISSSMEVNAVVIFDQLVIEILSRKIWNICRESAVRNNFCNPSFYLSGGSGLLFGTLP